MIKQKMATPFYLITLGLVTASGAELRNFLKENGLSSLLALDLVSSADFLEEAEPSSALEGGTSKMSPFTLAEAAGTGTSLLRVGGGGGRGAFEAAPTGGGTEGEMRSMDGKGT